MGVAKVKKYGTVERARSPLVGRRYCWRKAEAKGIRCTHAVRDQRGGQTAKDSVTGLQVSAEYAGSLQIERTVRTSMVGTGSPRIYRAGVANACKHCSQAWPRASTQCLATLRSRASKSSQERYGARHRLQALLCKDSVSQLCCIRSACACSVGKVDCIAFLPGQAKPALREGAATLMQSLAILQAVLTRRKGNKTFAFYDLTLTLSWAGRWLESNQVRARLRPRLNDPSSVPHWHRRACSWSC